MSEPQVPTPPAGPPAKKKVSPWVWVLGGCLVLILIVLLLMGACTWFVADKAKEMAANPAKTTAELAVKLNPDLELVATDDAAGTMTIRKKSTGEEVTLNFDEIAEGRFSFETAEGESTISFDPEGEGGLKIEGPDGTTTYGTGAGADLPSWLTVYPGASGPEGSFSSEGGGERTGSATYRTTEPVARVLEFYESSLKAAGMEVKKTTFTAQGSDGGMLTASSTDPERSATVMVSEEGGETSIALSFSGPSG